MKNRDSNIIVDVLTIILIVLIFIPQLRLLSQYNYLCLFSSFSLLFFILIDKKYKVKNNPVLQICFIYVLITSLLPLLFDHRTIFNRYLTLSEVFVFYMVYDYNKKTWGNKANMRILFFSLFIILYPTISTLVALSHDGNACRLIKTSSFEPGDATYFLLLSGVLGYELIYSVIFISITLFCVLMSGKTAFISKILRILIIVLIILFTVLVIMSNYFTATVLLVLGYTLALAISRGAKTLIIIIPVLCIYAVGRDSINEAVFDVALAVAPEGKTHERIYQMKSNLGKSNVFDDLDSREETSEKSLKLIGENPITGYITRSDFQLNNVGQHSYVLDTIAFFGIPIGLFGCYAMMLPILYYYRKEKLSLLKRIYFIVGAVYLFLLYRNGSSQTVAFCVFFFVPTVCEHMKGLIYNKIVRL